MISREYCPCDCCTHGSPAVSEDLREAVRLIQRLNEAARSVAQPVTRQAYTHSLVVDADRFLENMAAEGVS